MSRDILVIAVLTALTVSVAEVSGAEIGDEVQAKMVEPFRSCGEYCDALSKISFNAVFDGKSHKKGKSKKGKGKKGKDAKKKNKRSRRDRARSSKAKGSKMRVTSIEEVVDTEAEFTMFAGSGVGLAEAKLRYDDTTCECKPTKKGKGVAKGKKGPLSAMLSTVKSNPEVSSIVSLCAAAGIIGVALLVTQGRQHNRQTYLSESSRRAELVPSEASALVAEDLSLKAAEPSSLAEDFSNGPTASVILF